MSYVREEKINRYIEKEFTYNFQIEKEGLYAIEITANCRSWFQNLIKFVSFFKDDDLAVKIDGRVYWTGKSVPVY